MYIGVDVGGTKTLVGVLDSDGAIIESIKFETPQDYSHWLLELRHTAARLEHREFEAGAIGIPGRVDREHGRGLNFGNLPWENVPVQADAEKIFRCPIVVDNDAKLAALSEAMLHKDKSKVLYFTVSTGIGAGFIVDQHIAKATADIEGGMIMLPYRDKLQKWESFASGQAIYKRYGMKAADITDEAVWKEIAHNLALGFFEHIALLQPELIIIGGSIGTHFKKYRQFLEAELAQFALPVVPIPPMIQAARPEEAVVYGCYDLTRQTFDHA